MNNLEIVKVEHIFKTLGNRKRLALLVYLLSAESSLEKISKDLGLPYKTVARNLNHLQEAGFTAKRTYKNKVFYSINDHVSARYTFLIKLIEESCNKTDVTIVAKSLLKSIDRIDKEFSKFRKDNVMLE